MEFDMLKLYQYFISVEARIFYNDLLRNGCSLSERRKKMNLTKLDDFIYFYYKYDPVACKKYLNQYKYKYYMSLKCKNFTDMNFLLSFVKDLKLPHFVFLDLNISEAFFSDLLDLKLPKITFYDCLSNLCFLTSNFFSPNYTLFQSIWVENGDGIFIDTLKLELK